MQCIHCGREVPDTAKVCGHCGQRLAAAAPARPVEPVRVAPQQREVQTAGRKFPAWAWVVIGLVVVAGAAALLFSQGFFAGVSPFGAAKPAQPVYIVRACDPRVTAHSDAPIELHYGYWGALEEYAEVNNDAIDFQLFIDGKRQSGTHSRAFLKLPEVPCVDRANWDDTWWEHGLWMYDTAILGPLDPGEYQIEVVSYLGFGVRDGTLDDQGDLVDWGPGEVFRLSYTLVVTGD